MCGFLVSERNKSFTSFSTMLHNGRYLFNDLLERQAEITGNAVS